MTRNFFSFLSFHFFRLLTTQKLKKSEPKKKNWRPPVLSHTFLFSCLLNFVQNCLPGGGFSWNRLRMIVWAGWEQLSRLRKQYTHVHRPRLVKAPHPKKDSKLSTPLTVWLFQSFFAIYLFNFLFNNSYLFYFYFSCLGCANGSDARVCYLVHRKSWAK